MALLTLRQRQAFKQHRFARICLWILVFFVLLSAVADFVANSKPLVMRLRGHVYFPILETLTNQSLGIESSFLEVNYHKLREAPPPETWFLWPVIPFHPNESDRSLSDLPSAPDSAHWMGTDDRGRDVAARLLYGLRNSLIYTGAVWVLSFVIGILAGGLQGYFGGWVDFIFQRVIEVLTSIPTLFILIILVSMMSPSLGLLVVFTALLGWTGISYYVRADFLRLRRLEYVEAARAMGSSRWRLIWRHILPNALTPIITFSPFTLTAGIVGLAALDYLGFGLPPPSASWGELLNQAQAHFDHAWWLAVYPSLALMGSLLVLNFIGEGLREALDPRSGS